MLRQLKNNNKGVVLVTVLMIIIALMVLSVSAISLNVSQVFMAKREADSIIAKILAMGALAYIFSNQMSDSPGNSWSYTSNVSGELWFINGLKGSGDGGPFDSDQLNIFVSY